MNSSLIGILTSIVLLTGIGFNAFSQDRSDPPKKLIICPFTSMDVTSNPEKFEYYLGIAFLGSSEFEVEYNTSACQRMNPQRSVVKGGKFKEEKTEIDGDFVLGGSYSIYEDELFISANLYHTESKRIFSIKPEFGKLQNSYSIFESFGDAVKRKTLESLISS